MRETKQTAATPQNDQVPRRFSPIRFQYAARRRVGRSATTNLTAEVVNCRPGRERDS